jgi:NADH-quinone oxidoreductase subunit H
MDLTFFQFATIVVKAGVVMGALLGMASMNTWIERKASALIQNRVGANRASIFGFDLAGIVNTVICDPLKAITKEDFLPRGTSQFMHCLAPFLAVLPVILSFAVTPFGPPLVLAGETITLQLADLNVGILYTFAMGSLAVYGVVVAGWVSNNKFSLLGGLRASAQMISYEVTMGLSIVGLITAYGTFNLNEIVAQQGGSILNWGIFMYFPLNLIAFFLFFTSIMAETKRAPFDMPESESEIVAGYFTEYSGMKFLLFWLGEFAEIAIASTFVTLLFFGGWQLPYVNLAGFPNELDLAAGKFPVGPVLGLLVFGAKVSFFSVLQVVIRWTLPRFRYDQLMNLCWKIMLPISMALAVVSVGVHLYFKLPR